jgi:hypothetical protein
MDQYLCQTRLPLLIPPHCKSNKHDLKKKKKKKCNKHAKSLDLLHTSLSFQSLKSIVGRIAGDTSNNMQTIEANGSYQGKKSSVSGISLEDQDSKRQLQVMEPDEIILIYQKRGRNTWK